MNILFIATGFEIGGVTSAMRNLCNELVKRGNNVDILNLPRIDKLPDGFEKSINLINIDGFVRYWNLNIDDLKNTKGIKKISLLVLGLFKKITNKKMLWNKIVFKNLNLNKHYDIAIGFRQSPVSYWLVKYKCNADLSLGFWHTDADFENIKQLEECLHYPDKICCVSKAITNQMKNKYLLLKNKFVTVYNLFDVNEIKEKSNLYKSNYNKDKFNIVTVGRLTDSKNMMIIPVICKRIIDKGFDVCWSIIGDGQDREAIEQLINEYCLYDYIRLLGSMDNPYPYIKDADLFVLTSKWESYGMVVSESLILRTPVIAGEYPALHEILNNGIDGIIAENSIDGIANEIIRVLSDKKLYNNIKKGANQYKYSSDLAINQLMSLKDNINA